MICYIDLAYKWYVVANGMFAKTGRRCYCRIVDHTLSPNEYYSHFNYPYTILIVPNLEHNLIKKSNI